MVRLEALAAPPAEVVWIEAFMGYIETGMASEAKSIHREQREDRHEIFCRSLTGEFQNLSPVWEAQAGFLDS